LIRTAPQIIAMAITNAVGQLITGTSINFDGTSLAKRMTTSYDQYRLYLESLSPESLSDLTSYVADDVHFRDSFNDVWGPNAMALVFQHMFENVHFDVQDMLAECRFYFMAWHGNSRGK
jgi:hypothetical protein